METVEQLTRLAFEFGPFMFAIFVLIYLTKRANENYAEVAARTDPRPRREELRARRLVYYLAWFSGFALILISVTWWLYFNVSDQPRYISFKIESLNSDDKLIPRDEDVYTRTIFTFVSENSRLALFDYEILVPLPTDGEEDRTIRLTYAPSDAEFAETIVWTSLADAQKNKVFTIRMGEDGIPVLEPQS